MAFADLDPALRKDPLDRFPYGAESTGLYFKDAKRGGSRFQTPPMVVAHFRDRGPTLATLPIVDLLDDVDLFVFADGPAKGLLENTGRFISASENPLRLRPDMVINNWSNNTLLLQIEGIASQADLIIGGNSGEGGLQHAIRYASVDPKTGEHPPYLLMEDYQGYLLGELARRKLATGEFDGFVLPDGLLVESDYAVVRNLKAIPDYPVDRIHVVGHPGNDRFAEPQDRVTIGSEVKQELGRPTDEETILFAGTTERYNCAKAFDLYVDGALRSNFKGLTIIKPHPADNTDLNLYLQASKKLPGGALFIVRDLDKKAPDLLGHPLFFKETPALSTDRVTSAASTIVVVGSTLAGEEYARNDPRLIINIGGDDILGKNYPEIPTVIHGSSPLATSGKQMEDILNRRSDTDYLSSLNVGYWRSDGRATEKAAAVCMRVLEEYRSGRLRFT